MTKSSRTVAAIVRLATLALATFGAAAATSACSGDSGLVADPSTPPPPKDAGSDASKDAGEDGAKGDAPASGDGAGKEGDGGSATDAGDGNS
jgi:hypothetical protein